LTHLKKLASNVTSSAAAAAAAGSAEEDGKNESGADDDDDDVPDLVGNFDDASKEEGVVVQGKEKSDFFSFVPILLPTFWRELYMDGWIVFPLRGWSFATNLDDTHDSHTFFLLSV
jgi:hypothetical protein